jgi:hypothetical protein
VEPDAGVLYVKLRRNPFRFERMSV